MSQQIASFNQLSSININQNQLSKNNIKINIPSQPNKYSQNNEQLSCRICLLQLNIINSSNAKNQQLQLPQDIISPCNCTGSMKYIHQHCLTGWLNAQLNQNITNTYFINRTFLCEICKFPYQYQINKSLVCVSKNQATINMKQYWKQFLVVFLFIIILSVGLIILGYFDYKTDAVMKIDKQHTLFIILAIVVGIVIIALLSRLTYVYLLKYIYNVKQVKDKQRGMGRQNTRIKSTRNDNFQNSQIGIMN